MSAGYEWVWFGASFGRRLRWADMLRTFLLVSPALAAVFALIGRRRNDFGLVNRMFGLVVVGELV